MAKETRVTVRLDKYTLYCLYEIIKKEKKLNTVSKTVRDAIQSRYDEMMKKEG